MQRSYDDSSPTRRTRTDRGALAVYAVRWIVIAALVAAIAVVLLRTL